MNVLWAGSPYMVLSHAICVLSCMTLLVFWHFACTLECTISDVTEFCPMSGEPLAQSKYMPQVQAPRSWAFIALLDFSAAFPGIVFIDL